MRSYTFLFSTLFLFASLLPATAQESMIGEIKLFAGNFAPRGWMYCDGQELPIIQNQALFAILGTIYGGDGRSTFKLPDLNGPKSGGSLTSTVSTASNAGAAVKSRTGGQPATVNFVNKTNETLSAYWMDWEGKPVYYGSIPSGQPWTVNTGTMQYWRFTHGQKFVADIEVTGNKTSYDVQPSLSTSNTSNGGVEVKYIICTQGAFPARQ